MKRWDSAAVEKSAIISAMTTAAQLTANRGNAQHSTGPRSEAGKLRAARNATRHSLASEALVALPNENADDLREMAEDLRNELAPETALESFFTDRVISSAWRLKRAGTYENGVLRAEGSDQDLGLAFFRDAVKNDALGKAARYVRDCEASIRSSLRELERLQARRKGLIVPLPLEVDLTVTAAPDGPSNPSEP